MTQYASFSLNNRIMEDASCVLSSSVCKDWLAVKARSVTHLVQVLIGLSVEHGMVAGEVIVHIHERN